MNRLFGALLLLLFPINVHSFSIFPEYHSLTETEQTSLENPRAIDAEYQSDLITYGFDHRWHAAFLSSSKAIDWSAGSLSGNEFLIQTRAKFEQDLSEKLRFRFIAFQERDNEIDQIHQIVELSYKVLPQVYVGAYGEPSFYKRENDVGIHATYIPSINNEVRVFRTFTDLVRNERNSRDDRFHVSPSSTGVTWRKTSKSLSPWDSSFFNNFVDITFRYDSFTRWQFPLNKYDYIYEKTFLQARFRNFFAPQSAYNLSVQWDDKREGRERLAGSTEPTETWRTQRTGILASYEHYWSEHYNLRPGLGVFTRNWTNESGQKIAHLNVLPHVWWQIDHWQLGLESTVFRASGPLRLRNEGSNDTAIESRLNVRYDFRFTSNAVLSLMATADLDSFQTQGFEGGNGQFRVDF